MSAKGYVKLILSVVSGVLLFLGLSPWLVSEYCYMNDDYPGWRQQWDYIHTDKFDGEPDVIFFGDSRMKSAILPELIDDTAYNLALGGSSPLEAYYSMHDYLEHHKKPDKVIVGFVLGHFASGYPNYKMRAMSFHHLSNEQVAEVEKLFFEADKLSDLEQYKERFDDIQYMYRFPNKYWNSILKSMLMRYDKSREKYAKIEASRGHLFWGEDDSFSEAAISMGGDQFPLHPITDYYLRKLITLCYENDIPIYIESLPKNKATLEKLKTMPAYEQYREYMAELAKMPGVVVNPENPCFEDNMFGDFMGHFNMRGAIKYSLMMKEKYFTKKETSEES